MNILTCDDIRKIIYDKILNHLLQKSLKDNRREYDHFKTDLELSDAINYC